MLRGKHETDGTGRKIIEGAPNIGVNKQTLIRMVQQHRLAFMPIVERDMERATNSHNKLTETLMGMTATAATARNIIQPIGALDIERHSLTQTFRHGQITARIRYLWEIDDLNVQTSHTDQYPRPSLPVA